jgi:hypothetical protein
MASVQVRDQLEVRGAAVEGQPLGELIVANHGLRVAAPRAGMTLAPTDPETLVGLTRFDPAARLAPGNDDDGPTQGKVLCRKGFTPCAVADVRTGAWRSTHGSTLSGGDACGARAGEPRRVVAREFPVRGEPRGPEVRTVPATSPVRPDPPSSAAGRHVAALGRPLVGW